MSSIIVSQIIGTVPFTVNFAGLITNTPSSWTWDFADGKKQTFTSPNTNPIQNVSTNYTYANMVYFK